MASVSFDRRRGAFWSALLVLLASCAGPEPRSAAHLELTPADCATVPLVVEGNRPFVEVALRGADGTTRSGRFLVDSGGGGFLIIEALARECGLEWGEAQQEEGLAFAPVTSELAAFVGELQLELDLRRVAVVIGKDTILPPVAPGHAEGMLPGHILAQHHVVFDYPGATFTIARPGVLTPRGEAFPMPVGRPSGFPRTELELDGEKHGFLLDTGAAFTMVSDALLKALGTAHPDWQRHPGAFGDARLLGGQTLETMFVPGARWESQPLAELGITSQREGTFEQWMSSMMAAPIVGSLAGNVLKDFRVELDYAGETLYLSRP